jgi:hypothetical protein
MHTANKLGLAFALTGIFIAGAVQAHHAGVMFDEAIEVTLEGVVKEFQFTNPHSWLLVDVTDEQGQVTTWGFEAEGPTRLMLNGIRVGDFLPGTKLTITGHPMRDGRPAAAWTRAVREDGAVFHPRGE